MNKRIAKKLHSGDEIQYKKGGNGEILRVVSADEIIGIDGRNWIAIEATDSDNSRILLTHREIK
jgi:hypothetical protein